MSGEFVELFFNNGTTRSAFAPGSPNFPRKYDNAKDMYVVFNYTSYSTQPRALLLSNGEFANYGIPLNFTGYDAVAKGTTNGYIIEGRISWKVINTEFIDPVFDTYTDNSKKPSPARIPFGFDVSANFSDASFTNRESQLMWNQCCWSTNWSQSLHFGVLALAGAPKLFTATGVTISEVNNGALQINTPSTPLDLKATITPADAPQNVMWSVQGNTSGGFPIASIDQFGRLSPLNNGSVTVTATTFPRTIVDGSIYIPQIPNGSVIPSITTTTTVVISNQVSPTIVNISSPTIDYNWGTSLPTASVSPTNAPNLVSWSIIDPIGLATMNTLTGQVTSKSLANGSVTIVGTSLANGTIGRFTLPIIKQSPIGCFVLNAYTNINQTNRTKTNLTFSGFNSGTGALKTRIRLIPQYVNQYVITTPGNFTSEIPEDLVTINAVFAPLSSGKLEKTGAGWEISFNSSNANPVTITAVYLNNTAITNRIIGVIRASAPTTSTSTCGYDIRNFETASNPGCNPGYSVPGVTDCTPPVSGTIFQSITYTHVNEKSVFDPPFAVFASASSGLPVSFQMISGPALLSGNMVTLTGNAGGLVIRATQLGNSTYAAAQSVDFTVDVLNKSPQTITYTSVPPKTTLDIPFNISAAASSGLPVSFQVLSGPASVSGNQVTLNGTAGVVTIRASQAGNSSFLAAPNADFSFVVSSPVLQNQTITFPDVPSKVSTDLPFNLTATASSGLPVSFTLVQGPATLSGNQVTLNGNSGIIIIRASQSGNGNFNPATAVEKFILVNNASLANQTITFPIISDKQNNSSFNLSATASSGLTVSYEIVSGPANVSGNTVTLTSGYGNVTIRASQSGNGSFNPAQFVERTFNVCESIGTSSVTISNSGSSTFCLPLATTLTSSINYPVMQWSTGSTNPSIAVQSSGLYTLTVGSGLCKVVSNSIQITVKTPIITPICMVTVDEISGKNKVIFEKPSGYVSSITSWKMYRESTVANQYLLQSSLSLSNLSEYVDVTSFPATQAYRYKLETVDNNCNTANQSSAHKTMHLTINKGQNATTWNLIWTPYEGIPLATHRIYRGTSATNLSYLADVAGSLTSYTDASAPAVNNIYYVVELITGQSCNPTARTEAYTAIRSNVAETASTSTESEGLKNSNVMIYPNPTTGSFTISSENCSVYIITDLLGRKLSEGILTNGKAEVSDLNLASGIYLVSIGQYKVKLVVR